MATSARHGASSHQASNSGSDGWTNIGNVFADDGLSASCNITDTGGALSFGLYVYNFGFTIPAGSTINGIVVDVNCFMSVGTPTVRDNVISLLDAGTNEPDYDNKAGGSWNTSVSTIRTYGGAADKWNYTGLSVAHVNDVDFGFYLQANKIAGANNIAFVDDVILTVHYTPPAAAASSPIIVVAGL